MLFNRSKHIAAKDLRINRQITSREVLLIDAEGVQRGVVSTSEALQIADEAGLDLVEVSPNANPPVCKILNFGKYRYEQEKKIRLAKKNQTIQKLKEVRMQVKVGEGDMKTKCKSIQQFLDDDCKVKIGVRFRGREMQHLEIGGYVLDRVLAMLGEMGVRFNLEKPQTMEGRMMTLLIGPQKGQNKKGKSPQEEQEASSNKETGDKQGSSEIA